MSAMSRVALFVVACFALIPLDAAAWDRGRVERFASLPAGALNPEGITVDRHNGDVYVTGFNPTGAGTGQIYVFNDDGHLLRVVKVAASTSALLGLDFHRSEEHTSELQSQSNLVCRLLLEKKKQKKKLRQRRPLTRDTSRKHDD